jgi:hypothetical protein
MVILIIVICLYVLFKILSTYGNVKSKKTFKLIEESVGFAGIMFAIYFGITSYQDSIEASQKSDSVLYLTQRSVQIADSSLILSQVQSLKTISLLDSISKSSSTLRENLDEISFLLARFPNQINSISGNLSNLYSTTLKEYEGLEFERNKSANLKIFCNTCASDVIKIYIENTGTIEATINSFKIDPNRNDIQFLKRNDLTIGVNAPYLLFAGLSQGYEYRNDSLKIDYYVNYISINGNPGGVLEGQFVECRY